MYKNSDTNIPHIIIKYYQDGRESDGNADDWIKDK